MMKDETNLKVEDRRMLLEDNDDEVDDEEDEEDDDEDEIFNAIPKKANHQQSDQNLPDLIRLNNRNASRFNNNNYTEEDEMLNSSKDSTHHSLSQRERTNKSNKEDSCCVRSFQFFILNLTFLLNGATFCLFIFSREYFMHELNISYKTATNCLNASLFAIFIGIIFANLFVYKYERFYLLMICSFISSICLILLPLFKSVFFLFILFIFVFGLCFGFSKTIAYKWLTKNDKKLTNLKTKLVHIQFYFGLFIAFCLLVSIINSQSSIENSKLNNMSIKIDLSKRLPTEYDPRKRREVSSNMTLLTQNQTTLLTTTSTTTTSTKSHVKKPDAADGSYLEQSHITKPQNIDHGPPIQTTTPLANTPQTFVLNTNSSEFLKQCLIKLDRVCHLSLVCQNATISCKYAYAYPVETWSFMNETSNHSCSSFQINSSNCFNSKLIDLNSGFNYSCTPTNEFKCDAVYKCSYNKTDSIQNCFKSDWLSSSTTTTTSTSPATTTTTTTTTSTTSTTTTTTTTSTTTTTTSTTSTTTSTTTTTTTTPLIVSPLIHNTSLNLSEKPNFINDILNKTNNFYSNTNKIEIMFYLIGVFHFFLSALHFVLILPLIKYCFIRVCLLFLKREKKNQRTTSMLKRKQQRLLKSLSLPVIESSNTSIWSYMKKYINTQTWYVLLMTFVYGGLMTNFFTLMIYYLKSRVTNDYYYQVYFIYKLFIGVFLVPRFVRLCFCTNSNNSSSSSNLNGEETRVHHRRFDFMNRRPFLLLIKQNFKLYFIIAKLCLISIYQFSSTHFKDNYKLIMLNSKLIVNNSTKNTQLQVKLDKISLIEFGFVYPILLGNLLPIITSKLDDLTHSNSSMVKNQSYLVNVLIWSMILLGASMSLFTSNHLIYYLNTSNVFIYSNLAFILLFIILLLVYSCLSYRQQKLNKTTTSFLQANSSTLGMLNSFSSLKKTDLDEEITHLNEN